MHTKKIALYIHAHWDYNHPYAARTWTMEEWRDFLKGLKSLGYNAVMIWPVLETMPLPPTPSDATYLEMLSQVIEFAQSELDFHVTITLCPNVQANAHAANYTFQNRPYFVCDERINPADEAARRDFFARREALMKTLAGADAVAVIDSDPGGYPGSTDEEFTLLLAGHREMLDRLRPGIELHYWMLVGWTAYCKWWEDGSLRRNDATEMAHSLSLIKDLNPEPWGLLANDEIHLEAVRECKLEERTLWFPYAMIEAEPLFPLTIFPPRPDVGICNASAPRGVMGNAQTHCVQLPGIFAFACGARNEVATEDDYTNFANRLVKGCGELIHRAWRVLGERDTAAMKAVAAEIEAMPGEVLQTGDLAGLLLQSPSRFLEDLVMQLRFRAALCDLSQARADGTDLRPALLDVAATLEDWQRRTGFKKPSGLIRGELVPMLADLQNTALQDALKLSEDFPEEWTQWTDEGRADYTLRQSQQFYPQLIAAMKAIGNA